MVKAPFSEEFKCFESDISLTLEWLLEYYTLDEGLTTVLRWRWVPTIDTDGLRVNYTDAGTGLPLVFVPGLFGTAEWFRYQTSGLSDRYRVISCDLRSARGRADYSLDLLVNDLARFLDALKVYEAVVAGHALGAAIALRFAVTHPGRSLSVITISAAPSFAGVVDEELLSRFSPGEIEQETFWERLRKRLFGGKAAQENDTDPLMYLVRNKGAVDRATLNARLSILRQTDLTPVLGDVAVPVLVVAGARDWEKILEGAQILDTLLPDSSLEVIEDGGHFCFYTRHDLFNAILDDFISHEVARL